MHLIAGVPCHAHNKNPRSRGGFGEICVLLRYFISMSFSVEVPAGAVTTTTTLLYTAHPTATAPSGFKFAGHAFALDAYRDGQKLSGLALSKPLTVTIRYTDADVAGIDENTLVLNYWDGSRWVDAATTCTPTGRPRESKPMGTWVTGSSSTLKMPVQTKSSGRSIGKPWRGAVRV